MIKGYDKIKVDNEQVYKRLEPYLSKEFETNKEKLAEIVEKIDSIIDEINDEIPEIDELKVLGIKKRPKIKKITAKEIFNIKNISKEEIRYKFYKAFEEANEISEINNLVTGSTKNKKFIDKKIKEIESYFSTIITVTKVGTLKNIFGGWKNFSRKKYLEWKSGADPIPNERILELSQYFNLNPDFILYGTPLEYVNIILNTPFLKPALSKEECQKLVRHLKEQCLFSEKRNKSGVFESYPTKKEVVQAAIRSGVIPLPDSDNSIEELFQNGDYNKFNPLLTLTALAKDEDYSEEVHLIEQLEPSLKILMKNLKQKEDAPQNLYQLMNSNNFEEILNNLIDPDSDFTFSKMLDKLPDDVISSETKEGLKKLIE
ncbi:hypothetical protein ABLU29_13140 [Lactococcus lactis]|uniref:hypothetical protein n=1 Tax=Lactococcus lactis TaxID=1358 RepID=UPI003877EED3